MATNFDPQLYNTLYGFGATPFSLSVPSTTINRQFAVIENDAVTASIARVDRGSSISGLRGKVKGPRASAAIEGALEIPMRNDLATVGLILKLSGFGATPVQFGADNAWTHVIDPQQTAVDVDELYQWWLQDMPDGFPRLLGPSVIQSIDFQFTKGEVAKMVVTPLHLAHAYYDRPAVVAGTAAIPIQIHPGWLADQTLADKLLSIRVVSGSSPLWTCKAEFGAAPAYAGAEEFIIREGLDDEGHPFLTEITDSESLPPGLPIGKSDLPIYASMPSVTGIAALDEYSYANPIPSPTRVRPTEPEISVADICAETDGIRIADLESLNLSIVNTWDMVPGGIWGIFSRSFTRLGTNVVSGTLARKWRTRRMEKEQLISDDNFDLKITFRSDVLIDGAGAESHQFGGELRASGCHFADGASFKSFADGATDDGMEIPFEAEPDSGIGDAQWRATLRTAFADATA